MIFLSRTKTVTEIKQKSRVCAEVYSIYSSKYLSWSLDRSTFLTRIITVAVVTVKSYLPMHK